MTIHIRHNINISSCDGRFFSYNIICCALEFIKSLLQSRTNNIYCSTRNCICTKPNITTIPIYSVLDITAGYRILIYYVFVQHTYTYTRSRSTLGCLSPPRPPLQPPPLYHRGVIISTYTSIFGIRNPRV